MRLHPALAGIFGIALLGAPGPADAGPTVPNAGFEQCDEASAPIGWTGDGVCDDAEKRSGKRSACLSADEKKPVGMRSDFFPITPSALYEAGFFCKIARIEEGSAFSCWTYWYDAERKPLSRNHIGAGNLTPCDWRPFSSRVRSPQGAAFARIEIKTVMDGLVLTAWFDDVWLKPIPPPPGGYRW